MSGPDTDIPETFCPFCDAYLDSATELGSKRRPSPGDLSVCLYCAEVLIFGATKNLRKPHVFELEAAYTQQRGLREQIALSQAAARKMIRTGRVKGKRRH